MPRSVQRIFGAGLIWAAAVANAPAPASAQAEGEAARSGVLNVFLDCNTRFGNSTFFPTEITFVNWVRDRTLSQVHLIVTSV